MRETRVPSSASFRHFPTWYPTVCVARGRAKSPAAGQSKASNRIGQRQAMDVGLRGTGVDCTASPSDRPQTQEKNRRARGCASPRKADPARSGSLGLCVSVAVRGRMLQRGAVHVVRQYRQGWKVQTLCSASSATRKGKEEEEPSQSRVQIAKLPQTWAMKTAKGPTSPGGPKGDERPPQERDGAATQTLASLQRVPQPNKKKLPAKMCTPIPHSIRSGRRSAKMERCSPRRSPLYWNRVPLSLTRC